MKGFSLPWTRVHGLIVNRVDSVYSQVGYWYPCSDVTAEYERSPSESADFCSKLRPTFYFSFRWITRFSVKLPGIVPSKVSCAIRGTGWGDAIGSFAYYLTVGPSSIYTASKCLERKGSLCLWNALCFVGNIFSVPRKYIWGVAYRLNILMLIAVWLSNLLKSWLWCLRVHALNQISSYPS